MPDDDAPVPLLRRVDGKSDDAEITSDTVLYEEYRNHRGELHREDGPAIDFAKDDKRNQFWLDGKQVSPAEFAAYAQAKAQALRMKKSWQENQIRQLTEGSDRPIKVRGPFKLRKP